MKQSASALGLLLVSFAATRCSSRSMPPVNTEGGTAATDGGAGAGGGAGGAGGGAGAAAYAGGCPDTLPANTSACTVPGRVCSYGSAPRAECRARATCTGGVWAAAQGSCKPPSAAAECPPSAPAAQTACPKDQQLCEYPDGKECVCFAGSVSSLGWICDGPRNTGGSCPVAPPNAGTACTGSTSCTYVCGLLTANAVVARCVDGAWTWAFMPCATNN